MRKLITVLAMLAVLAVAVVPTFAQDEPGTIVDIAAGNEDFSTLVTAVGLADPAIAEALSGEGAFTVFAPNNDAFANVPAELLTAALADQEMLSGILLYHVVEGELFAADVLAAVEEAGGTLEVATLSGANITVTVQDGNVFVNDSQVIATDIDASNGVIHVIDNVLIPPAGEEEMAEEMMDEAAPVNIRVAHFSPDAPPVDIYVNGEVAIPGLPFAQVSAWVELPAGSYDIAVVPSGTEEAPTTVDDAVLSFTGLEIAAEADQRLTVAAIGRVSSGTLTAQILVEDYSPLEAGNARVGIFHAIDGAPAVDVLANGGTIVPALFYPGANGNNDGYFELDVPAGTYDLSAIVSGTSTVIVENPTTLLFSGNHTFFAAIGTPGEPQLFAVSTPIPAGE